ncbi:MAG: hypothetical protein FWF59_11290 [Turicibacter sp.]|nr:hypothetical protein [Turicibacter sp.]
METNKKKDEEEYAAELMPSMMDFSRFKAADRPDDGLGFFRGIFFGSLMAIPLWIIIHAIGRLFGRI